MKAKLPTEKQRESRRLQEKRDGFKPCGQARCPICDQLSECDKRRLIKSVKCSTTGEEIVIKGELTCSTSSVIYCITCLRGGRLCPSFPQYIGETKRSLKERMRGHRGSIIQPSQENCSAPKGIHFKSPGHSISDLRIIPIEHVKDGDLRRKVRESFYIQKFDTVYNGLNIRK